MLEEESSETQNDRQPATCCGTTWIAPSIPEFGRAEESVDEAPTYQYPLEDPAVAKRRAPAGGEVTCGVGLDKRTEKKDRESNRSTPKAETKESLPWEDLTAGANI